MKKTSLLFICLLMAFQIVRGQNLPDMPMAASWKSTLAYKQSQKQVFESKQLGSTETLNQWKHQGYGELSVSHEKYHRGNNASLLLESPTKGTTTTMKTGAKGRPWGAASAIYQVPAADWSDWNRISFWIYPDLPGFKVISINMIFHNNGEEEVPGPYNRNGMNYEILKNQQWNKVYWNIGNLGRDKVTGIEIRYRLQGNEPGATDTAKYYIDKLRLEKVPPYHYEGWDVGPGRIAYNQIGYVKGMPKIALISNVQAEDFSLVNTLSNKTVLQKPISTKDTPIGTFRRIDFSEVDQDGTYMLKAGDTETKPFKIGSFADVYRSTVIKTINLFYSERCGFEVPGIHSVNHRDFTSVHNDKSILINGGWHDAGDLSQGVDNTSEATYAMFTLSDSLRYSDPVLSDRLLKEAKWGLEWILKTRFGDGYRDTWATMDFWTDGIIGTIDDAPSTAENDAVANFTAAKTEAKAAMVLKDRDPALAKYSLESAKEDWKFASEGIQHNNVRLAGVALNASLTLLEATGKGTYKNAALSYGDYILQSQQQENIADGIPLKGFFYRTTEKKDILHYSHKSDEQDLVVGLVRLSQSFPDNSRITQWRNALRMYADYYKRISKYTDPYFMLPAGIYDLNKASDKVEEEQIKNGVRLNERYFMKRFPVWKAFRGNTGTILSQAKGLSAAANYLNDRELLTLSYKQLDWQLGLNPFTQSLMYGAGDLYAAQYSAMSGNIVGGLPVGVQTHFNRDEPYWPASTVYNWKEIFVFPSSRWLWIMTDFF